MTMARSPVSCRARTSCEPWWPILRWTCGRERYWMQVLPINRVQGLLTGAMTGATGMFKGPGCLNPGALFKGLAMLPGLMGAGPLGLPGMLAGPATRFGANGVCAGLDSVAGPA